MTKQGWGTAVIHSPHDRHQFCRMCGSGSQLCHGPAIPGSPCRLARTCVGRVHGRVHGWVERMGPRADRRGAVSGAKKTLGCCSSISGGLGPRTEPQSTPCTPLPTELAPITGLYREQTGALPRVWALAPASHCHHPKIIASSTQPIHLLCPCRSHNWWCVRMDGSGCLGNRARSSSGGKDWQ